MTSQHDDSDCTDAAAQPIGSGPQHCTLERGLDLVSGKRLSQVDVTYETWGELDETGTNAVVICHALTGDSHVATGPGRNGEERPGWWDVMVGPGMTFDTRKYFVVCMVNTQAALLDFLGVKKLVAVVGGSVGGMQALAWAKLYPERVRTCIGVATGEQAYV